MQDSGKRQDLCPRGDVEQHRAIQLLGPLAAVQAGRGHGGGLGGQAQQGGQQGPGNAHDQSLRDSQNAHYNACFGDGL